MRIESLDCPQCGAPLALKPGQTLAACVYCNATVRITPASAEAGATAAQAIRAVESIENLRFCLLRAEVASPELPQKLEEMGALDRKLRSRMQFLSGCRASPHGHPEESHHHPHEPAALDPATYS